MTLVKTCISSGETCINVGDDIMEEKQVIFYKPKQLIALDKTEINRFQIESMNFLLKKAQDVIYYNSRVARGEIMDKKHVVIDEVKMLNYKHIVTLDDFIKFNSSKIDRKHLNDRVMTPLSQLKSISVRTMDKNSFGFMNIFQEINYDYTKNRIEYVIANKLTESFANNTSIITDDDENKEMRGNYTPLCLSFDISLDCSDVSYNFVGNVLRYATFTSNNRDYITDYNLDDFKCLIGVGSDTYKNPVEVRRLLKKIVKEINSIDELGIKINLELIGRGKFANLVRFSIVEVVKIPSFLSNKIEDEKPDLIVKYIEEKEEVKPKIQPILEVAYSPEPYDDYPTITYDFEFEMKKQNDIELLYDYLKAMNKYTVGYLDGLVYNTWDYEEYTTKFKNMNLGYVGRGTYSTGVFLTDSDRMEISRYIYSDDEEELF